MKVLLADDHPTMRFGTSKLLDLARDIKVIGEADSAEGAILLTQELGPDLVILDLHLKSEISGIEACREIKTFLDPPKVLVYTAYNTAEEIRDAILAGADSYVHKGTLPEEFVQAVQETAAGKRVWLTGIGSGEAESMLLKTSRESGLTAREREVLILILKRYSNAEISQEMHITLNTVKRHVSNILKKLEIKTRRDLFRGLCN